jgi:hypothetical protein
MTTPGTPAPVAPTPIPRTAFGTTALVLGILAILGLDWIVTGSHSARSSSAAGSRTTTDTRPRCCTKPCCQR